MAKRNPCRPKRPKRNGGQKRPRRSLANRVVVRTDREARKVVGSLMGFR